MTGSGQWALSKDDTRPFQAEAFKSCCVACRPSPRLGNLEACAGAGVAGRGELGGCLEGSYPSELSCWTRRGFHRKSNDNL